MFHDNNLKINSQINFWKTDYSIKANNDLHLLNYFKCRPVAAAVKSQHTVPAT